MLALLLADAWLAASLPSCAKQPLPSVGETLVVVDTDMPVPTFVNRIRIDIYTPDGSSWYSTRDTIRPTASEWPVSFGVVAPDTVNAYSALVRLRAYAEGNVRDYRGERYAAPPPADAPPLSVTPLTAGDGKPRLIEGDADVTPATEPEPSLAIDRLVRIAIAPGARDAVDVVLRGACVGTMVNLSAQTTCVDTAETRVLALLPAPAPAALPVSQAGSFHGAKTPCTATPRPASTAADGTPLYDEEICVPGALFYLGSPDSSELLPDLPKRIALVAPLRVDKYEMTVARYRAAIAAGFESPDLTPLINEGPIPTSAPSVAEGGDASLSLCSWSFSAQGRESYGLSCVSRATARDLCAFFGGDLPTEAQWEYLAADAGRAGATRYPWGGNDSAVPGCNQVVASRASGEVDEDCVCSAQQPTDCGYGPLSVTAREGPSGDETALGIVGLGGGLSEYVLDAAAPLDANCWARAPLEDPACIVEFLTPTVLRGGTWANALSAVAAGYRDAEDPNAWGPQLGFRCVRPGVLP
jgi:formylglycine-generating enzyme required for sulfatase activity